MPILASLGTANDRAFGFGDSSFASGYALPAIITNNAEIIYDASNPLSNALGRSSFIIGALYPSYNSNDRRYGDYWYIPVEAGTQVFPGDTLKNYPGLEHTATVIDVERNVEMYNSYGGVTVTGDRVVINSYMVYSPSMVYPSSTSYWYDISGNNHNATLVNSPSIGGFNNNQYFTLSKTGTDKITIPTVITGSAFTYVMVCRLSSYNSNSGLGEANHVISSNNWYIDDFVISQSGTSHGIPIISTTSQETNRTSRGASYAGGSINNTDTAYNKWVVLHFFFEPLDETTWQWVVAPEKVDYFGSSYAYYTGTLSSAAINSGITLGGGDYNKGPFDVKMVALYPGRISLTTDLDLYNALKDRFNL